MISDKKNQQKYSDLDRFCLIMTYVAIHEVRGMECPTHAMKPKDLGLHHMVSQIRGVIG